MQGGVELVNRRGLSAFYGPERRTVPCYGCVRENIAAERFYQVAVEVDPVDDVVETVGVPERAPVECGVAGADTRWVEGSNEGAAIVESVFVELSLPSAIDRDEAGADGGNAMWGVAAPRSLPSGQEAVCGFHRADQDRVRRYRHGLARQ